VVFSHGMGGSRMGYSYFGRYLAQQGFAVLHLQHAGSDRAVWTSGVFSMISNLKAAASDANAIARAQDVSFAITRMLADERFAPRIDAAAIAVAGHSYGANTAMLVSGAVVERDGKRLSFKDERVKAAIIMSAPPFYGDTDMRQILKPISVPTLHITGTEDVIKIPGYYSDARDRVAVFEAMSAPNKSLAVFAGATHSIFTDRMAATPELSAAVKSATRELAATFLNVNLRGAAQASVGAWLAGNKSLLARGDAPVQ
jgi:predicted dienelactone hydrolase